MKKTNIIRSLILPVLIAAAFCTACAKKPTAPTAEVTTAAAAEEVLSPVQEEAISYFTELVETALGTKPEEVRIDFKNPNADIFKEKKVLSELLNGADPVFLVGFVSASQKGYTEDEIRAIVMETKKRGNIVDLYFNFNDDYLYQVRADGVMIDKATGKDGGAMREQFPYE